MKETLNFSITNTTKGKLPSLPFVQIKEAVLGKKYSVSLVFISEKKSKKLNLIHREKNKVANVLSFPLGENEGEIFITPAKAKIEAEKYNQTYSNFLQFLFIHGLTHLKGFDHGEKMENFEKKIRKMFDVKYSL